MKNLQKFINNVKTLSQKQKEELIMEKKIYEVTGTITVTVTKRVAAQNEDEAFSVAEELFTGIHTGNNDTSIFVQGIGESLEVDSCDVDFDDIREITEDDCNAGYDEIND